VLGLATCEACVVQAPPLSSYIISYCIWLYHRFRLSFRDVEEMMLERGVGLRQVVWNEAVAGVNEACLTILSKLFQATWSATSSHTAKAHSQL
jgi:transposase-like protein